MMHSSFKLSQDEKRILTSRMKEIDNRQTLFKTEALLLADAGVAPQQISKRYSITPKTLLDWYHEFKSKVGSHLPMKGYGRLASARQKSNVQETIIDPVCRTALRNEVAAARLLGKTSDDNKIFLTTFSESPAILREIGRLREETFRSIGEGTGQELDIDDYDSYYAQLFLWDDEASELVGAYRIGCAASIVSNAYPKEVKNALVYFFAKWFPDYEALGKARCKYAIRRAEMQALQQEFAGHDYNSQFRQLKKLVKYFQVTIPVLYKQYTDICSFDGTRFIDFHVDRDFQDCVDGLILVDIHKLKPAKVARYLLRHQTDNLVANGRHRHEEKPVAR